MSPLTWIQARLVRAFFFRTPYRASKVEIIPETTSPWGKLIDPMDYTSYITGEETSKRTAIEKAYQQSGVLNANAALWTAFAVLAGTLTTRWPRFWNGERLGAAPRTS